MLVEGGPSIIGAFLAAGLVDEIDAYLAPMVLGGGAASVEIPGITTLTDAHRFSLAAVDTLGDDVLVRLTRTDDAV